MSFEANVRDSDGMAVLELHGDVDGGADTLLNDAYERATAAGAKRVLLNFDDVAYINSTGIALIVGLLAEARGSGRSIVACGLTDHYKDIFEITRLTDFVTIVDDEASATAATQT